MKSKIKNIIFDLGGVVLDIEPMQIFNQLQEIGFTQFDRLQEDGFLQLTQKFERGIYTAKTFRRKAKSYLHLEKIADQEFDDIWNSMLLDIPHERIEALEEIKQHYQIYLMSNSNELHYDLFVRDLQLRFGYAEFDALFDKSYFSFVTHMTKPDPDFFEYVLDQNNIRPEETLFIDDTEENIEAAKKLGMKTYLIGRDELVRNLFDKGVLKDEVKVL